MKDKTKYWLDMCDEDLITAKVMLDAKQLLWAGFICHLIVEKALKAIITESTDIVPPKIHVLRKLAELGGALDKLNAEQVLLLQKLMPLHVEARYPEHKEKILATLTVEYINKIYTETEAFVCWIKQQLEK